MMRTTRTLTFCTGGLLLFTLVAGAILSSTATHADDTVIDNINISVPVSCNINSAVDEEHSASVYNGTYEDEIGATLFRVFCNDNSGFSIYAIGYSNFEFGNTKMLATVAGELAPTYDIVTGTATSGSTSNWAMKLIPIAGTYAPTILNNYNDYNVVPSTYTKVATFASTTGVTIGSELRTTYAAFISSTQPAGAYNGKVKYTLVHPANETPLQPHDATARCISYWPNASGVIDNMWDQCSYSNNQANVILWPTNFKRDGYGFAGWSDKYDWVLNENDANGNGTGANAGYHIYGPMQSITTPADMTTKGLSLYAVWVPSQGNLQGWTGCGSLQQGKVTALTDTRDNDTYAVAKLVDGNCWMIENMRLDYTADITPANTQSTNNAFGGVFSGLAEPETANFDNSTTANSLYKSDGSGDIKGVNGATLSDIGTSNLPGIRFPRYRNDNTNSDSTINPNTTVVNMTTPTNANIYSYGNYYSWAAAIADTGYYGGSTNNQTVTTSSLCPTGWHLPSGGHAYASDDTGTVNVTGKPETYREFYNLGYKIMGSNKTAYEDTEYYGTSYYSSSTTNANGDTAMTAFRRFPNNFLYSGHVNSLSVYDRGITGHYWSSTARYSDYAYELYFGSSNFYPGTSSGGRYVGFTVRCLADGE